jgi:hypothetical protein
MERLQIWHKPEFIFFVEGNDRIEGLVEEYLPGIEGEAA